MEKAQGRVFKYGDDVNTDIIIAARYLSTSDPAELARHCMEDGDPDFPKKVRPGDIMVAGKNFGCGSSREHAPVAIKAAGVACVIAKSYARIFYRNAFNMGLAILECPDTDEISGGETLEVDFDKGVIRDTDSGKTYKVHPIPPFMQELVDSGGLMAHISKKSKDQA